MFYVFCLNENESISYIAFPHTNTAISFFKNTTITSDGDHINIQSLKQHEDSYCVEILGKYTRPVFVHYNGGFNEIAIIFKPLGVNHFFSEEFYSLAPGIVQSLKIEAWLKFAAILSAKPDFESQVSLLESFLLILLQQPALDTMYQAIEMLADINIDYSIEEVAATINMTVKTFQRHFLKHLACTPIDYKRIARFRHSLGTGLMAPEIKKLTSIAYDSNYYDQSYFVREYRKLTNHNPRALFDSISVLDDNHIVWKIR